MTIPRSFFALVLFSTQISGETNAPSVGLVCKEDLVHVGAFRMPREGRDVDTFSYGGRAIGYNPQRNTLFVVGHKHHQRTAEVSIPPIVKSDEIADLKTATIVQPFADATGGQRRMINPTDPNSQVIGGQLVYDGRLYVNVYSSYDGGGTQQTSLFVRSTDLTSDEPPLGPLLVGRDAHLTSAYMAIVPEDWRERLGGPVLAGNCCRSIISNQSHGPAISVLDPANVKKEKSIGATELLRYSSSDPLGSGATRKNAFFNLTTRVDGVVFPESTRSILFFGKHGIGEYCYGEATHCNDPAMTYKGTHAYPYVYQVWAYDSRALAKTGLSGRNLAAKPYAIWSFNLPFEKDGTHEIGGVAYDPGTGNIYLSQVEADRNARAIIHVFRLVNHDDGCRKTLAH